MPTTLDPLYNEAKQYAIEKGKINVYMLQRKFEIGFSRAARILDLFEQEGLIERTTESQRYYTIKNKQN